MKSNFMLGGKPVSTICHHCVFKTKCKHSMILCLVVSQYAIHYLPSWCLQNQMWTVWFYCFRYNSLGDAEKRRLEYDEDRLLSVMLYNQAAFMLMMRVPKNEIKKKIRRLLGKSHIGLVQSQDINNLLDNIQHLVSTDNIYNILTIFSWPWLVGWLILSCN